jgi:hypothetical protein
VKRVLRVTSEWVATQFSKTVYESPGLFGLPNPFATCESNFGGYIGKGSESIFLDCLKVKKGCVGRRIHSSPVKRVSRASSEWAGTKFSLTVYESKGAVWADECISHL